MGGGGSTREFLNADGEILPDKKLNFFENFLTFLVGIPRVDLSLEGIGPIASRIKSTRSMPTKNAFSPKFKI